MSVVPLAWVTDTTFKSNPEFVDCRDLVDAICDWLRAYDVDPEQIPASTSIVRDKQAMTITYEEVFLDAGGRWHGAATKTVVKQLDKPPAPWPDVILALGKSMSIRVDPAIADAIHAQRHYQRAHPATPDTFWAGMRHAEHIARGDTE